MALINYGRFESLIFYYYEYYFALRVLYLIKKIFLKKKRRFIRHKKRLLIFRRERMISVIEPGCRHAAITGVQNITDVRGSKKKTKFVMIPARAFYVCKTAVTAPALTVKVNR